METVDFANWTHWNKLRELKVDYYKINSRSQMFVYIK